jgi:hypothetical protein
MVSTHLHKDRYLNCLRQTSDDSSSSKSTYPIRQADVAEDLDTEKVAQMVNWFHELGLEAKHEEYCAVAGESNVSSTLGLEEMFEILTPVSAISSVHTDLLESDRLASPGSDSLDGEYFTGENTHEVGGGDAAISEDEWVYWGWDDVLEDDGGICLAATG